MANGQTLAWRGTACRHSGRDQRGAAGGSNLYIGGDTGFFTPKYKMKVYFHSADGLHKGALVLVNGVRIGNVSDINLTADPDTNRAVEVGLQLLKSRHDLIRTDSVATIGTVGVLGDQQVEITRGSPSNPVIEDGGKLQGMDAGDIKQIISNTNDVVANLGVMTSKIGALIDNISNGKGTAGKFLNDTSIYDKTDATVDELHKLVVDAHSGTGTIGRLLSDDEMYQSMKSSVDRLNSTLIKVDTVDKIRSTGTEISRNSSTMIAISKGRSALTTFGMLRAD
jgi:phospholipid/cholesterol/gamma-HCH transport system substrate-binding protein